MVRRDFTVKWRNFERSGWFCFHGKMTMMIYVNAVLDRYCFAYDMQFTFYLGLKPWHCEWCTLYFTGYCHMHLFTSDNNMSQAPKVYSILFTYENLFCHPNWASQHQNRALLFVLGAFISFALQKKTKRQKLLDTCCGTVAKN